MSEEYTLLSEEELLTGIATVNGPKSHRSSKHRSSGHSSSGHSSSAHRSSSHSSKTSAGHSGKETKKSSHKSSSAKSSRKSSPAKSSHKSSSGKSARKNTGAKSSNKRSSARTSRAQKKKSSWVKTLLRVLFRTVISIVVVAALSVGGLCLILNQIFNGPSPAARDTATMSFLEASGTKWLPRIFLGDDMVAQIKSGGSKLSVEEDTAGGENIPPIPINTDTSLTANSDEWKNYPDGIRIEKVSGNTYNAYVMLVRDPSRVYLATSSPTFSMSVPGTRITEQIEKEGAIAAVNAGAFFDNGTSSPTVGSVPEGLVISGSKVVWNSGAAPEEGFVGFNQDNVLVVADTMTADRAMELGIRDGCCFGPVLVRNGNVNNEVYNSNSGFNPRTAIGQRVDGSVILVCIDGRQAGSLGGTYADIIDIMVEYEAVNACNLDGGSSTVMLYRDAEGRYGEAGKVQMINNYSLLQEKPRKMPTFIMVRPSGEA